MKNQLLNLMELKQYSDYIWTEISIGCSDTNVYKLTKNNESVFLKVGKSGLLTKEYLNLKRLKGYLNVPNLLFYYNNDIEILITTQMQGKMSCEDEFIDNFPKETLDVLCDAIKKIQALKLNEKLIKEFDVYDIDNEIKNIKKRISFGEIKQLPQNRIFNRFLSLDEMVIYLEKNKPEGELYFSHGDVSMPNVFIKDNQLTGFIDVGNAGIRQKWYDITDLYVSIRRNFESQEIADAFLKKLGIEDKTPIEYYEMLINLS